MKYIDDDEDGYISIMASGACNVLVAIQDSTANSDKTYIGGKYSDKYYGSVFVRKGMKAYIIRDVSGTIKRFYSLE